MLDKCKELLARFMKDDPTTDGRVEVDKLKEEIRTQRAKTRDAAIKLADFVNDHFDSISDEDRKTTTDMLEEICQ